MWEWIKRGSDTAHTTRIRVTIEPNKSVFLPRATESVRVDFGCLWLTEDGRDIVLRPGESYTLRHVRSGTLATALIGEPTGIEVCINAQDSDLINRRRLDFLALSRP